MKYHTIKNHLAPYSIYGKRKTTINNAFASALAPCERFNPDKVTKALSFLGQNPDGSLVCVYCSRQAETWDHIVSLVKDSKLNGYGHQIGNLIPCCKSCNSEKGGKDWQQFLKLKSVESQLCEEAEKRILEHLTRYAVKVDLKQIEGLEDWQKYNAIHQQILELMKEADSVAGRLREHLSTTA